ATKQNGLGNWAGFYRNVIESTYFTSALTVTLGWGQGESDVDLYVKEPDALDGSGRIGDTVYYGHRNGESTTNPYLDLDNTGGFGPEHYIAVDRTKTLYTDLTEAPNLYGDYTIRIHYYADHDSDSMFVQP